MPLLLLLHSGSSVVALKSSVSLCEGAFSLRLVVGRIVGNGPSVVCAGVDFALVVSAPGGERVIEVARWPRLSCSCPRTAWPKYSRAFDPRKNQVRAGRIACLVEASTVKGRRRADLSGLHRCGPERRSRRRCSSRPCRQGRWPSRAARAGGR